MNKKIAALEIEVEAIFYAALKIFEILRAENILLLLKSRGYSYSQPKSAFVILPDANASSRISTYIPARAV